MWLRCGQLVLAASLISATSCAATKCGDYRYLAFQPIPGMIVLETRVPEIGGLQDVKPFPVSYVLKRDGYQMVVRVYEKGYGPTATLSVEGKASMTLQATSIPMAADGTSCIVKIEQGGGVKFSWLGKPGCTASQTVGVAILDATGARVATEELPFSVVTNGRYCVKDGL